MQIMRPIPAPAARYSPKGQESRSGGEGWLAQIFEGAAAQSGGVVRRPVRDVEQTIGRDRLRQEVKRRGYHMIECGGQFLIICSKGRMVVHA